MSADYKTLRIRKLYTLTAIEKELVGNWLKQDNISSDDWADERFINLKKNMKSYYLEQQKFRCCYCLQELKSLRHDLWDLEHIVPTCEKPKFMFEPMNLCVSCKDCNKKKGVYVPLVNKKVLNIPTKSDRYKIFHAHLDEYEDHIICTIPGDFYKARNDKGYETIINCGLLRFYKYTNKDAPDSLIDDLARGVISSTNDVSRDVLEKELLKKLLEKHSCG
ncbi:HNH endonuclease [Vibrio cholerae]|uniref:HNH endonuclease n=1 Tax=Vibrio cholerae TaxID=666 RepID=UPI0011F2530F|nr:hypothetical protein [Vibrio cholerae]KAA1206291.1 hypothetical protein F0M20_03550 [Vibrio cholerae]